MFDSNDTCNSACVRDRHSLVLTGFLKLLKDSGGIVLAIMSTFLTIIGLSGNLSSIKKSKYATLAYGITLLRVIKVRTQLKKFFSKISDFEENKRQYSGICPMVCCV